MERGILEQAISPCSGRVWGNQQGGMSPCLVGEMGNFAPAQGGQPAESLDGGTQFFNDLAEDPNVLLETLENSLRKSSGFLARAGGDVPVPVGGVTLEQEGEGSPNPPKKYAELFLIGWEFWGSGICPIAERGKYFSAKHFISQ